MHQFRKLDLEGVIEIVPARHGDDRGFFSEVYNAARFKANGIRPDFVQDNHSYSQARGVLRGLHFQLPPFAQDKLVRVVKGAVFDVAVDIRTGSPTFGQWVGRELSAEKWNQLFIPAGYAHGFMTLEPDTEFLYKVSAPYSPEHDRSIRFDDPAIGIDWPISAAQITVSDKDRRGPLLAEIGTGFSVEAGEAVR
ncbi:dTDP-4-dehydrorhamnose 3,5-epimerase [Pseudohoeflea coraliihabitans]|uniref:dTDP-4-dehydrorhamnose 3,5-epimerase n=1 Tax=Pseudohoeflea coraliihabitans TaxID=2860393 RepID=A0ABS6WPA0_9HYPH|nr:dTDP-4-dehydrorhamnose 3,5-epimerase [Pseudohoeflea sp. DP4N28-3]MBW3096899.1 dTDP-4-dehydrorhamnose 3,5-epimerase [Pseudohoeflea sp. DP4N28-3]